MIYQTSSTQLNAAAGANTAKTTGPESGQGKDVFLKMFMTQMTNQNPLDPMDNTQFTAQLAQFSSLEQLTKISTQLEGLAGINSSVQTTTALSLVGKVVDFNGQLLSVAKDHVGEVNYNLAKGAKDVKAVVTDQAGKIVAEVELGEQDAGANSFQWDGKDSNGEKVDPGIYKVTIAAFNGRDEAVKVEGYTVSGLVTGYERGGDGKAYLLLGEAALPLEKVLSVKQAPQTASSAQTVTTAANPSVNTESGTEEGKEPDSTNANGFAEAIKTIASAAGMAAMLL